MVKKNKAAEAEAAVLALTARLNSRSNRPAIGAPAGDHLDDALPSFNYIVEQLDANKRGAELRSTSDLLRWDESRQLGCHR